MFYNFVFESGANYEIMWKNTVQPDQWRTQEFFSGWGVQQIQLRTEDIENGGSGGGSHLVRGSEGSCNLVQEISFHMVIFS